MKNYAKVGNKTGKPAYRTPSTFIIRKSLEISQFKIKNKENIFRQVSKKQNKSRRSLT